MSVKRSAALAIVASIGLTMALIPSHILAARPAAMPSDFNGDGYADLAIGVPFEDVGSKMDAGAVNVIYGSSKGLTASGDQLWSEDSPGVKGKAYGWGAKRVHPDRFGADLVSGDFDGDGYADLAVSAPGARTGSSKVRAGAITILYGTRHGLTADGNQRWSYANLPGMPTSFVGRFLLAAGDFDHDGHWDLAIGVPHKNTGKVIVLSGSTTGLRARGAHVLTREMTGAPIVDGVIFPIALAAGDLNGDGFADLAAGAWEGIVSGNYGVVEGSVSVFYGGASGLEATGSQWWTQHDPGMEDGGDGGSFGDSLAIGDFDGDSFGDLAVGVPLEGPPGWNGYDDGDGAVAVLYGSNAGLSANGNQLWLAPPESVSEGNDQAGPLFGAALAAGDFDGDGADDLAVAAPQSLYRSGVVVAMYGGHEGLSFADAQRWSQDSAGVPSTVEFDDQFGFSLASADYGRSGRDDLAIGVPGEDAARGKVDVLYGRTSGLSSIHAQVWSQDSSGIKGRSERDDGFGGRLTGSSTGRLSWP
jgi:FG-GAP repeat